MNTAVKKYLSRIGTKGGAAAKGEKKRRSEAHYTAMSARGVEARRAKRSGDYSVTRFCCLSGNCSECRGVTAVGIPVRIVHAHGYSKDYAEMVAGNWARYAARAELIEEGDRAGA